MTCIECGNEIEGVPPSGENDGKLGQAFLCKYCSGLEDKADYWKGGQ